MSILKNLNFEQNYFTDKQLEIIRCKLGFDKYPDNQLSSVNLSVEVTHEAKPEISSTTFLNVNFPNEQPRSNLFLSIDQSNLLEINENSFLSYPNKELREYHFPNSIEIIPDQFF
jgi:hypothetical protein